MFWHEVAVAWSFSDVEMALSHDKKIYSSIMYCLLQLSLCFFLLCPKNEYYREFWFNVY